MTTKPKADGWNHRSGLEDRIAELNNAIDQQNQILARTTQRSEHDQAVATAAKQTIRQLEATRSHLIKERNARR